MSDTIIKELPHDLESAHRLIALLSDQLSLSQNKIRLLEHELEKLVRRRRWRLRGSC